MEHTGHLFLFHFPSAVEQKAGREIGEGHITHSHAP